MQIEVDALRNGISIRICGCAPGSKGDELVELRGSVLSSKLNYKFNFF